MMSSTEIMHMYEYLFPILEDVSSSENIYICPFLRLKEIAKKNF
jgi:hypothetical protein